jgi:Protein of unknown function (DUF2934)
MQILEWVMDVNLEQVRVRAYEMWLRDGRTDGRDRDHWHAAESELLAGGQAKPKTAPAAPKRKAKSAKTKM